MVTRGRSRRRVLATVLVVGLVVSVGCTGSDEDGGPSAESRRSTEPPGWEVVDGPAALEPWAVEEEALWASVSAEPFQFFGSAEFRGDSLILQGGDESDWTREHLGVLDAATGRVRWVASAARELTGGDGARLASEIAPMTSAVVDLGEEWAVLAGYELARGDAIEHGAAVLSGEDGHVVWRRPIVDGGPGPDDPILHSLRAGDGFAVALTGPRWPLGGSADGMRAVGINAHDGSVLWERSGTAPVGIAGQTVLAHATGSVLGLDGTTGEVRWEIAGEYFQPRLVLTAGDLAVVEVVASNGSGEEVVIEASSGRQLASWPATVPDNCAADDELIACGVLSTPSVSGLATLRVDDRQTGVSERTLSGQTVEAVVDGRILLNRDDRPPWVSVDRFANTIDTDLPGRYLAGSDRYAIFQPRPDRPYAVYRLPG